MAFLFQIPLWLQPTAFHLSSKLTNNYLLAVFIDRALIKTLCWYERLLHCPTSLFLYEVYYLFIEYQPSLQPLPQSSLFARKTLVYCLSIFAIFSEKIDSSSGKEFSAFEPLLNNVNEIYPDLMCEYCCPFCYLGLKMSPFITNEGGPWSDIISHRVVSSMISWLCPFNPPLSHPESSNEGCIPFRTTLRTVPTN